MARRILIVVAITLAFGSFLWLSRRSSPAQDGPITLTYWLWDGMQVAAYERAARVFEQQNPDIRVEIQQVGWSDYWISLTTALISNTAPDVFANHCTRGYELAQHGALRDLTPWIRRDGLSAEMYQAGLWQNWSFRGGHYGIPKDWDTVALAYNQHMLDAAGVTPADLEGLEWNPRDGGSFGRMIAKLTLDEAGENGLSPKFDRSRIRQYGLLLEGKTDGVGHVDWASFAAANGFSVLTATEPTRYQYEDPRLAETLEWIREARRKGWIASVGEASRVGALGLFAAEKGALASMGSWMFLPCLRSCSFPYGFVRHPTGPAGRFTLINGLADSISATTRHPEEAWRLVKFFGSRESQLIIASYGAVFPAIPEAAEKAAEVMSARGPSVNAFVLPTRNPGSLLRYPITGAANDLNLLARAAMDRIFLSGVNVRQELQRLNDASNALLLTAEEE